MTPQELAALIGRPDIPDAFAEVDSRLDEIAASCGAGLERSATQFMRSRGKRLRPFLVLAAAAITGKHYDEAIIHAAVSVELVHLGTVIHDDIIDDSPNRRGQPTLHKTVGMSQALLIGDNLLALACAEGAAINAEAAAIISNTVAIMCDGQSIEVSDNFNLDRRFESYFEAISKKTSSLTSAACRMGGLAAGLPDSEVGKLGNYGEAFGTAYQLLDDLCDLVSTEAALGKPVGQDVRAGVYTLPILLALEGETAPQLRHLLKRKPVDTKKLMAILETEQALAGTLAEGRHFTAAAVAAARALGETDAAKGLARLPTLYLQQVIDRQIPAKML
jgi:geranylgeranyl pyrophosphate synthase